MTNLTKYWNNTQIRIREDGYVCLTDIAKATNKRLNNWMRLPSTNDYMKYLSEALKMPESQLIQCKLRGRSSITWGHKYVAIEFARKSNTEFGVWCNINLQDNFIDTFNVSPKDRETSGFVYLVIVPKGWCKIGVSKTPYRRLSTLQVGTPLELTLKHRIFTLDMFKLEKALHEYYAAYWMRGEWFALPEECISEFPVIANELDAGLEFETIGFAPCLDACIDSGKRVSRVFE